MNNFPIDALLSLTEQLITDFYEARLDPVCRKLHPDILWIGAADGQYLQGYETVRGYFEKLFTKLPACAVRDCRFDVIYCDGAFGIVAGYYTGRTLPQSKTVLAARQRLTFIWKRMEDSWKVLHMHISNPLEFQEKTEYFPNAAGRRTYLYMQHLLQKQNQGAKNGTLIFHGKNAETYFFLPDDICCIEADNIRSVLHTQKGTYTVCQSIGELSAALPPVFLRIHRSFIVNRHHVAEIKRYTVRMKNGMTLPVPEKRYRAVSRQLLNEPPL